MTGTNPRYRLRAGELRRVQPPVLFAWGDKDVFGNLDVARHAAHLVPNAKLHEMQTGHLPFADKPEECGRVIRKFLSEEAEG